MINEDVEELFEYLPLKTNVWIGTEEVLAKWRIQQYVEYEKVEELFYKYNICLNHTISLHCIFIIPIINSIITQSRGIGHFGNITMSFISPGKELISNT